MSISILHRVTGNGLAVFGIGVLLCWLSALAGGPAAYDKFLAWFWADWSGLVWSSFGDICGSLVRIVLRLLLIGLSWSFFNHAMSGLRHFALDIGAGYELKTNALWSLIAPAIAIILTAAFWAVLLLR